MHPLALPAMSVELAKVKMKLPAPPNVVVLGIYTLVVITYSSRVPMTSPTDVPISKYPLSAPKESAGSPSIVVSLAPLWSVPVCMPTELLQFSNVYCTLSSA